MECAVAAVGDADDRDAGAMLMELDERAERAELDVVRMTLDRDDTRESAKGSWSGSSLPPFIGASAHLSAS